MNATEISARLKSYQSDMLASVAPQTSADSTQLYAVDLRIPEFDDWQAAEVLAESEKRGIDYRALYRRASTRDAQALRDLILMKFEGEATDGHAWFLNELLDLVGDAYFAEALAKECADAGAWVGGQLLLNMGFDHGYEQQVIAAFSRRYPRTYLATVAG